VLAPCPTPKLQDHPLSAVRDCLFSIFEVILHIGGRSSIRNLRARHAVVTGTHLSHWKDPKNFLIFLDISELLSIVSTKFWKNAAVKQPFMRLLPFKTKRFIAAVPTARAC
jgi:hypothetical protein